MNHAVGNESEENRHHYLWPFLLFVLATFAVNASITVIVICNILTFESNFGYIAFSPMGGLICGEFCLAVAICGLCGRHWLAGYAAATALTAGGVISAALASFCYSVWFTDRPFSYARADFNPLLIVPPTVLLSAITMFAFRGFQGWRLTRRSEAPHNLQLSIIDLIVCTALVAALLMFARTAIVSMQWQVNSYLMRMAVIVATFCLASLVAVAPAVWIVFRIQQRRAMKLGALIVINCLLASVVLVVMNQFGSTRLSAQIIVAQTVLWVAAAFGYAIIGLALLRKAGFQLRTRHDALAISSYLSESTLQTWVVPAGVIAYIVSLQLVFAGIGSYRDSRDSQGRQLQREVFARGGQAELDRQGDVLGMTLGPAATRDEIRALLQYPNLQYVKVESTTFDDSDVQLLRPLKKLKSLNLNGTSITDLGLEEIAGWPNVFSLSVEGTKCTAVGLRKFVARHPLYQLDIGHLNLTDAEVVSIATAIIPQTPDTAGRGRVAPEIRLGLAGNPITNDALAFLSKSVHQWSLDLTDCNVDEGCLTRATYGSLNLDGTGSDLTFTRRVQRLRIDEVLSMDRTEVTDAVLPSLRTGQVRHLKLGETHITEQGLSGLGLDGPVELSLNSRKFTGSCFATWKPNLQILNMSHSGVTDAEIGGILQLPRLSSLHLSDTEVTDSCLQKIAESKLSAIDLRATRVTAAGLARQDWGEKTISIAADQFTEPEFKMLLKQREFTVMPPVHKRP